MVKKAEVLAHAAERQGLLTEFGDFFEDDPWHPHQRCVRAAKAALYLLKRAKVARWKN